MKKEKPVKESNVVPPIPAPEPYYHNSLLKMPIAQVLQYGLKVSGTKSLIEKMDGETWSVLYPDRSRVEFASFSEAIDEFLATLQ